jgi:protein TonB
MGNGNGKGIGNGNNGTGYGTCLAAEGCFGYGGVDQGPKPIATPQPEFSEEARKAKQQGIVGACMWVTSSGTTSHIQIVQPLGYGLDEEAKKTLATWKFKPAMKDGKAVTVSDVCVNVNFHMY